MSYGYPPPAHHQQWYGAPPAPPVDPYRAWYADQLAQLTFNSRPIIQHLSMQAMEQRDQRNMPGMQAIAEEIENAVLRVRVIHRKLVWSLMFRPHRRASCRCCI